MGESKISRERRNEARKLLLDLYPGNFASVLVSKLADSGITAKKSVIYNFFYHNTNKYGLAIMTASKELIKEAQLKDKELAKEFEKLAGVQDLNTQKMAS